MDELSALKSFRAERDVAPSAAREAIWLALEARIEAAAELASPAGTKRGARAAAPSGLLGGGPLVRGLRSRRRPLALAGAAAAVAAVVAVVLLVSSGPSATPASAAEVLYEAADSAAARPTTSLLPQPGQYLLHREERLGLEGWIYPVPSFGSNQATALQGGTLKGPHAYNALMPVTSTHWTGADGGGRWREVAGAPRFWSEAEEARWKAAGSPLPPPFNPEYQRKYRGAFKEALELNESVVDTTHPGYGSSFHFPDTSKLPTEARALRETVESGEADFSGFNHLAATAPLTPGQTAQELVDILGEGIASPALQAAVFGALAELPGIVSVKATDGLGRGGQAIRMPESDGTRFEYIFDPATGQLFASRIVLVDPNAEPRAGYAGIPAGTTLSERDILETAIVGSLKEGGGPEAEAAAAGEASAN
jgi:hypothetical protein